MSRFLQCPGCHGIALVIYGEEDAGCGTYDKLHANTTDAALEKHLPVVEVKKNVVQAYYLGISGDHQGRKPPGLKARRPAPGGISSE